jgi:hypothetical protein
VHPIHLLVAATTLTTVRRYIGSRPAKTENHLVFERLGCFFFFVDQSQNLRGQGPFTGDESITMRIGLGQAHLFAREGLKFQHLGFRQIPYPFKFGICVHT